MKRSLLIRFWVVIGILALARNASAVGSVDDQVKMLAARYSEVEDQLARSVRYASRDDKGDTEQAWFNGSDDLIKLAVERRNGDDHELTGLCLCEKKRRRRMAECTWRNRENILAKEKEAETVC